MRALSDAGVDRHEGEQHEAQQEYEQVSCFHYHCRSRQGTSQGASSLTAQTMTTAKARSKGKASRAIRGLVLSYSDTPRTVLTLALSSMRSVTDFTLWALAVWFLIGAGPAAAQITLAEEGTLTRCASPTNGDCSVDSVTEAAGNLILGIGAANDDDGTFSVDELTNIVTTATAAGTDNVGVAEYKIAAGTEPDNLVFNSANLTVVAGKVIELSGVNEMTPIGDIQQCGVAGTADTNPWPVADCTVDVTAGDWVFHYFNKEGGDFGITQCPMGWTTLVDPDNATFSSNLAFGVCYQEAASTGTLSFPAGGWDFGGAGPDAWGATFVVQMAAAAADPDWDSAPTVSSQTSLAYTIGYDANADADDIFCVAWPKDATPPTDAEIEAGTGAHGTATEAVTGSADSIVLTPTDDPVFKVYDLYCVLKADTGEYSLVADGDLLDEQLDVASGFNRAILSSIDMTSPFFGSAVEVGDYCDIPNLTDPDGYATDIEEDATVFYLAGGDTSRQILVGVTCYDIDGVTILEFTLVFNNQAPNVVDPGEWPLEDALYELNTNPAFTSESYVEDFEGDAIAWSVTVGALPDDWSLNATTGEITDGTPGACGPFTFTLTATDAYGSTLDLASAVHIGPRIPDVEGDDEATATAAIEALCSLTVVTSESCSALDEGLTVRTSPAIGTLVEEDAEITVLLSSGVCGSGGELRLDLSLRL